ncbi:MAG: RsmB/NOP family class I SAM-dependent RNA methyltransferase [Promethearchaeota archaeon]
MEEESKNAKKSQRILNLLNRFLKGEIIKLKEADRIDPIIFHYYNEIIRFWSKLNFIIKKTFRSIENSAPSDIIEFEKYLYSTYRKIWESAPNKAILKEIEHYKNSDQETLSIFLNKLGSFSWDKALKGKNSLEKLSIEEAIPSFVVKHLSNIISFEFLKKNIRYMNDIRKKATFTAYIKENIENELREKVKFQEDKDINNLFHIPIKYKKDILKSRLYQSGDIIILDKGSALIVFTLEPQINEKICDFCAAPGIKTSLIAYQTKNKSWIIAGDFHTERTKSMKNVLLDLKLPNIYILNEDSINFPIRFEKYFDRILLDAPCTGSGTFLSNPEIKWRQNESFLYQNITLQRKLIESAIKLLRPNGIFVYSTCSLYPEEGEYQILDFVDDLEPLDLPTWISPSYKINNTILAGTGRLFPSVHQTQGFFIGKFKKRG